MAQRAGVADPQERDKQTGERVWLVRVIDLDVDNQRKGTAEVGVKIAAPQQPVPPAPAPGSPLPAVEFVGLTLTPYVDSQRCTGKGEKCRARLAYSLRAMSSDLPSSVAPSRSDPDRSAHVPRGRADWEPSSSLQTSPRSILARLDPSSCAVP